MKSKPKVLFLFDHPRPEWLMDGLSAALNVLEKDFDVRIINIGKNERPGGPYDFVLGWGAFNSSVDQSLKVWLKDTPKGLCIAGNATPPDGANNYDILFYETKWYRSQIDFHPNIVQAFGVNTDIFSPPGIPTPVVWDYIGVGALASWKRWEKLAGKQGRKLVVGEYQPKNEQESLSIVRQLVTSGVMVSNQVHPLDLVNLYSWSRTLYMPSDIYGGGERAVLEARACGLNVEIEEDNPKLKELLEGPIPSHHDYAAQLKKGIESVL